MMPAESHSPARRPWRMEVPAIPSVAGPGPAEAIIPAPSINGQLSSSMMSVLRWDVQVRSCHQRPDYTSPSFRLAAF